MAREGGVESQGRRMAREEGIEGQECQASATYIWMT